MPAGEESQLAEEVPCGLVDAAGVGDLGIAEPIGDGLGCIMVAARQLKVTLWALVCLLPVSLSVLK